MTWLWHPLVHTWLNLTTFTIHASHHGSPHDQCTKILDNNDTFILQMHTSAFSSMHDKYNDMHQIHGIHEQRYVLYGEITIGVQYVGYDNTRLLSTSQP